MKSKVVKTILRYLASGAIGALLFFLCRPYAMAHRLNPALYGGEVLIGIVPLIIMILKDASRH